MKFERAVINILEELFKKGDKFTQKEDLRKVRLGKNKIDEVLNFLNHKKLVVGDKQGTEWRINPDGIEYMNNYKAQQRQEDFNRIVAVTAAILALIGVYDFLVKLNLIKSFNWITTIFVVFAIGALGIIVSFLINSYLGRN